MLCGIATDWTPAMIGSQTGAVTKKKKSELNMNTEDLGVFHCIRHQQNLFAKWMKFNNMTITVVFCTNFINARASTSPTVLRISYRSEPPRLDIFVVDSIGC